MAVSELVESKTDIISQINEGISLVKLLPENYVMQSYFICIHMFANTNISGYNVCHFILGSNVYKQKPYLESICIYGFVESDEEAVLLFY